MDVRRILLTGSVSSHLGYVRANNEDNFLLQDQINDDSGPVMELSPDLEASLGGWYCFGVFDGMGGGERGEVASWLAAKEFQRLTADRALEREDVDDLARKTFRGANRRIIARHDEAMYGTTGTVVFTDGTGFKVYHLGDSRAYLFRQGALFQLTKDQTLAAMKIELGIYSPEDPRVFREQHQLTEYIGCDPSSERLVPQETAWLSLLAGDRLLLCSDGLYDMCEDTEIRQLMGEYPEPIEAAWKLTERALQHGGKDNVTCLVVAKQ